MLPFSQIRAATEAERRDELALDAEAVPKITAGHTDQAVADENPDPDTTYPDAEAVAIFEDMNEGMFLNRSDDLSIVEDDPLISWVLESLGGTVIRVEEMDNRKIS